MPGTFITKQFIIQEVLGFGFWSDNYKDFKGYLFVSRYNFEVDAIKAAHKIVEETGTDVKIIPIFTSK